MFVNDHPPPHFHAYQGSSVTSPNGFDWSPEALHADMAAAGVLKFESAAA